MRRALLLALLSACAGCSGADAMFASQGLELLGGCLCTACDTGLSNLSNCREGRERRRRHDAPPLPGQDLERLARYANDPDPEIRGAAIRELIVHLRRAIAAESPDPVRAERIAQVLRSATGFEGGIDPVAWETWWREGEVR
ncbi:MAG: hypothetical protein HY608_04630 [Planctomycetes bacterium]|nr:hypothetical protein [Planctomycetota bacterium]